MDHRRGGCAILLLCALSVAPARAQQKTGPGVAADDRLTWHGITLYGVVDAGIQYDSHSAPFTPFRPAASGNVVRSNDYSSPVGVTPSNMGQSRIGLQVNERLAGGVSVVLEVESFFNPQSGELADSMKSITRNNGKPVDQQRIGVDGSSAGQVFQTDFIALHVARFGELTVGRQVTLLSEGMIQYDPNFLSTAFGLLGGTNQYAGGGSNEDNRLDDTVKYLAGYGGPMHLGAMYKYRKSAGSGDTAWQADIGGNFAGASLDAYYSKINSAIAATALNSAQANALLTLGFPLGDSVSATISDNTAYALMASYRFDAFRFFAGYEHIKWTDPARPLPAGYRDIGDYVLAFVTNSAYVDPKQVQVYWSGIRYSVIPKIDLTGAFYLVHQDAYGTGIQAGCATAAHSTCSGRTGAVSLDADYRLNVHLDFYVGAMYSVVHDGMASGYLHSTNINPTIGFRYKF